MVTLEITINGEESYTAGIEDWDSLYAILSLVNVSGDQTLIDFNVGGTCKSDNDNGKERGDSIRWKDQFLQIYDEISMRIIETDSVDEPARRLKREELEKKYDPKYTPEEREAMERETYRRLKKKYE